MTNTSTTIATPRPTNHASTDAIATCRADYKVVSAAVRRYRSRNGMLPPAGTAWTHTTTDAGPLLRAWQRDRHDYTIQWNGSTLSVVPAKGVTAHDSVGTSAPPTGCFAA